MASRVVFFDQKIGGIGYLKERGYIVEGVIMGFKLFERATGKLSNYFFQQHVGRYYEP